MPESQALQIETNVAVPMRDGTILYADLYRPEGPGPYPVLLQRTPYDKTMLLSFNMLDSLKAAKRGYAVVIQTRADATPPRVSSTPSGTTSMTATTPSSGPPPNLGRSARWGCMAAPTSAPPSGKRPSRAHRIS